MRLLRQLGRQSNGLALLGCALSLVSCGTHPAFVESTYKVQRIAYGKINVDGVADESVWDQANSLLPAIGSPWRNKNPQNTEFKALWDGSTLYYSFILVDADKVSLRDIENELDIGREDRVEIFIANIDRDFGCDLRQYIGLETDYSGRVIDFTAIPYRQFDFSWTAQTHSVASNVAGNSIVVEGAIAIEELAQLGVSPAEPSQLNVGVFRGDFSSLTASEPEWLSWVDPETPQPDFHVCSAFGVFRLE